MFINSDLLSSGLWEQNKTLLIEKQATDPKIHTEEPNTGSYCNKITPIISTKTHSSSLYDLLWSRDSTHTSNVNVHKMGLMMVSCFDLCIQ